MVPFEDYINNPCRLSSIPYWKQRVIKVPDNMKIVHDDEYDPVDFIGYNDEPYFRLYHDLQSVQRIDRRDLDIVVVTDDMLDTVVDIIYKSYDDLSVTIEQMEHYRQTPVYCPDLWVLLKDKSGVFIGCGIADYDKEADEMILEWMQVIPAYRGCGYGQYIVNYLLAKACGQAKFATVSGKINNATHPERLYRKCGFKGSDVWHILTKIN